MNQHTDERTHHRKLVRHKTSRRHAWGEGIWTFMLNDFCCFSSKSIFASFPQPRTRQRKKTKLNKELVRHKTSTRLAWGPRIWNFYVERLVVFLLHPWTFPACETVEETKRNSFDKTLPGSWPEDRGPGTFMLNDFFVVVLLFIFEPRTRQRKKTKL